jgi:hypothetical protein
MLLHSDLHRFGCPITVDPYVVEYIHLQILLYPCERMNNLLVFVLTSNGKIWNNRSPERFISGETETV